MRPTEEHVIGQAKAESLVQEPFNTVTLGNFPDWPEPLTQYRSHLLNGTYVMSAEATMNGKPVYIGDYKNFFFIYFCQSENDWRIGIYVDWGHATACQCNAYAHTAQGADFLGTDEAK